MGAALEPAAGRRATFPQVLGTVASMPYGRAIGVGKELAERFEVDQSQARAESGIFLDPKDLAALAADGCEVANHTRSHLFCRSIVDEAAAEVNSLSTLERSSR